jgi:hypothetical protein
MADRDKAVSSTDDTTQKDFLLTEYQALAQIDGARNERLDRYLTLFLTLAASPWALYVLIVKNSSTATFTDLPLPLALVFVLVGLLGSLVTMMFIQVRFTIIMYMRAMNDIRGHFSGAGDILRALRLPIEGKVPPYSEKGGYIWLAVIGMASVNSSYVSYGSYFLGLRLWCLCLVTAR